MYELKKIWKGIYEYEKRIYRAVVSQSLRNIALQQHPYDHNHLCDCMQETGPRTDNNETEPTQSVQDAHQQSITGTTYTATHMLLQYHIQGVSRL